MQVSAEISSNRSTCEPCFRTLLHILFNTALRNFWWSTLFLLVTNIRSCTISFGLDVGLLLRSYVHERFSLELSILYEASGGSDCANRQIHWLTRYFARAKYHYTPYFLTRI